jgi:steroid delta-isomerase-like uncharacterized protein
MPEQDIRAIARRYVEEVVNQGNMELIDELVAPDVVYHIPSAPGGVARGTEAFRHFREELSAAFPDLHIAIASIIAEGDQVSWRGTAAGSQRKGFDGLTAMGRHAGFMVGEFYRFANGRIAEAWVFYDTRSVRQQLGAT